jgi:hypothetical protein
MVADDGVGDRREVAVTAVLAVPVVELVVGAVRVDVAQVAEGAGVPALDDADHGT